MRRRSWPSARSAHARWHEQARKKKKNGLSVVGKGEGRDGPQDEANI